MKRKTARVQEKISTPAPVAQTQIQVPSLPADNGEAKLQAMLEETTKHLPAPTEELNQRGYYTVADDPTKSLWLGLDEYALILDGYQVGQVKGHLDITAGEMVALEKMSQASGRSIPELLRAALDHLHALGLPEAKPVKIPRGFVLVNLCARKQKELRDLARETGQELRGVLQSALNDARERLQIAAKVKRLTGWGAYQQATVFLRTGTKN